MTFRCDRKYCYLIGSAWVLAVGRVFACEFSLDGDTFLAAASVRGLVVDSTPACSAIHLALNKFYAPPGSTCNVIFSSSAWLLPGFQFKSLKGSGNFKVSQVDDGLSIVISESGGFRLEQINFSTDLTPCNKVSIDSILK